MTDREAAIEFVRGAGFVILMTGIFFGFILTLGKSDSAPAERYKVVDHYGTCAVVRYTDDSQRWHYFLDCREVR